MGNGQKDISNEKNSNEKDEEGIKPRELDSKLVVEENVLSANEFDNNLKDFLIAKTESPRISH